MKSFAETAIETRLLVERIRKSAKNELMGYPELNQVSGCDVRNGGRGYLTSARRIAEREFGIVTDCVFGEGIKHLEDAQVCGIGHRAMRKIRKAARRAIRTISTVDVANLPREAKTATYTAQSLLGVISTITKPARVVEVESEASKMDQALPLGRTLELFTTKK